MLSRSTTKYVRSLRQQKYRQKYHKIVVEGVRSVNEIIADQLLRIESIYATEAWTGSPSTHDPATEMHLVSTDEMTAISAFTTPQEVLAVCDMPEDTADPQSALSGLCLYMDGIRDPGNAGTIFRIADWFGIRDVFMSADCVDPYNPKVIQASMGSLFRIRRKEVPLMTMNAIPGIRIYATVLGGSDIYNTDLSAQGLIVLGNEAAGIRNLGNMSSISRISIPSDYRLGADSLNVAIAAAIICAEFRRRG